MKIKFLTVFSVLILLQLISYSQYISGFGIKGGVTLSDQKHEYKKFDYNYNNFFYYNIYKIIYFFLLIFFFFYIRLYIIYYLTFSILIFYY